MQRIATVIVLSSIGLLLAQPAFADSPNVCVVPQQGGLFVGITGLYVQPQTTNGILDYSSTNYTNNPNFSSQVNNIPFGNNWNEIFTVGYTFPHTANDIAVSYLNLKNSDKSSITANSIDPIATVNFINNSGTLSDFGPANFNSANSSANISLDQVDVTFGQYLQANRLSIHALAGLSYIQADENQFIGNSGTFVADVAPELAKKAAPHLSPFAVESSISESATRKSSFDGLGPLLGADLSYELSKNFSGVAHLRSAFYGGYQNSHLNYSINTAPVVFEVGDANIPPFSGQVANSNESFSLVERLDLELGANYSYLFNNQSQITLEGGYYCATYFNLIDKLSPNPASLTTTNAIPSNDFGQNLSLKPGIASVKTGNFSFFGPYVSLTFHA